MNHTEATPLMRRRLDATIAELSDEFHGIFSTETVTRYVEESFDLLVVEGPTTGPNFLTLIVDRFDAAFTHHLSDGRIAVRSAGSRPEERIEPVVIEAMSEIGVDVTEEFPKPLTDEVVRAADVVITMGCGDACPVYPGKRYEDWVIADPAGQPLEVARRIRYDNYHRVCELIEGAAPTNTA